MHKARLIINPISGTRSKAGLDRMVMDTLSPLGWEIEVAYTKGHGDATRLAKSAIDGGCDTVLAAGGDGTINETAAPCVARESCSEFFHVAPAMALRGISAYRLICVKA